MEKVSIKRTPSKARTIAFRVFTTILVIGIVGFPILELFWRRENPFFNQVKLATATTIMGVNCG